METDKTIKITPEEKEATSKIVYVNSWDININ